MKPKLQNNDFSLFKDEQRIFIRTIEHHEYHLHLDTEVGEPSSYRDEFALLREASENDVVLLHINTGGGLVSSMHQWRNAIFSCSADVIGVLHNQAYSAGSAIALACDDWIVFPSTEFMCHNVSFGGDEGKERDVVDSVIFISNQARDFVTNTYRGFLTPKEIEKVFNGRDLYFNSEDVASKLTKYKTFREKQQKAK